MRDYNVGSLIMCNYKKACQSLGWIKEMNNIYCIVEWFDGYPDQVIQHENLIEYLCEMDAYLRDEIQSRNINSLR